MLSIIGSTEGKKEQVRACNHKIIKGGSDL